MSRSSRARRRLWFGGKRRPSFLTAQALVRPRFHFGRQSCRHGAIDASRKKTRTGTPEIDDILTTPTTCSIARELIAKIARARDQLLVFCSFPGEVEPTNNGCERALRPTVIQRMVTNGYRAMWPQNMNRPSAAPSIPRASRAQVLSRSSFKPSIGGPADKTSRQNDVGNYNRKLRR